jgi:hypothetical protein
MKYLSKFESVRSINHNDVKYYFFDVLENSYFTVTSGMHSNGGGGAGIFQIKIEMPWLFNDSIARQVTIDDVRNHDEKRLSLYSDIETSLLRLNNDYPNVNHILTTDSKGNIYLRVYLDNYLYQFHILRK